MSWDVFADLVGLFGAVFILGAYYLLEADKLHSESKAYPLLNLVGACFLLFSLCFNWNMPAVIIEIAWIGISLWGAVKAFKRQSPLM